MLVFTGREAKVGVGYYQVLVEEVCDIAKISAALIMIVNFLLLYFCSVLVNKLHNM